MPYQPAAPAACLSGRNSGPIFIFPLLFTPNSCMTSSKRNITASIMSDGTSYIAVDMKYMQSGHRFTTSRTILFSHCPHEHESFSRPAVVSTISPPKMRVEYGKFTPLDHRFKSSSFLFSFRMNTYIV